MSRGAYEPTPRISYIAVAAFNADFFTYTTSIVNLVTVGVLTTVTGATAGNCPAGRVLRENGRKLYPGGAYSGVSTYMVGVYDPQSMLSGFIDPNGPVFAPYNGDKPNFWADGVDPGPLGPLTDLGAPVLTNSTVEAVGTGLNPGDAAILADNGSIVATNGQIRVAAHNQAAVTGSAPTQSTSIDMSLGQIFLIDPAATTTTLTVDIPATTLVGAVVKLILTKNTGSPSTCVVTFTCSSVGATIHTQGTLSIVGHQQYVVCFMMIHNSHLLETSRTVALTNPW